MWIIFSLIAPIFFALVHIFDSYCVDDVFERPWMGMITSALASIIVFAPLPYVFPLMTWNIPPMHIILLAIITGVLIQLSQVFYFQALEYSEAGIVAAYWNMVPALVPILSFILLNERLESVEYIAIATLISSSILFCLIDTNFHSRWKSFSFMLISAVMQAIMFILQDIIFDNISYYFGFLLITIGIIITGIVPLCFRKVRAVFIRHNQKLISVTKLLLGIEILNLLAIAFSQKAVDLGIPSLVAAVESTIPAYTFIFLLLFMKFAPKFGDFDAGKNLHKKFGLIFVMTIAVAILS